MKQREAFVANSSSSSFILNKKGLAENQLDAVRVHLEYAKVHFFGFYTDPEDAWLLEERESEIHGWTQMDSFDMLEFFERLRILKENYEFDGSDY